MNKYPYKVSTVSDVFKSETGNKKKCTDTEFSSKLFKCIYGNNKQNSKTKLKT